MQNKELAKAYEPREVEKKIYDFWMDGNYFHAEVDEDKKPYSIVIPPPNITGQLHLGHAYDETVQDILTRWKRMQGYSALWLPGTDHASIATEAKIVDAMREEGITKADIGRGKFLERAWEWKEKYGNRIVEQLKLLGSSCDWERLRFTMDEGCSKAVRHVFKKLYDKELIYRGERIVNWCPECGTAISDAEVDFEEKDSYFWHIRYPLSDGSGFIELATTRPETMLGDTAVAVHPSDERYKHLVGKNVILPLVNKEIPVIADEYVEMDFGTGVVKITPAHDPNDFEVGKRHDLPVINVMDEKAVINENGGSYKGMKALDARKKIVADLEEGGYLIKVEPIKHNVGTCSRCHTVVEPRVSTQWFVKMEPLAKPAIDVVRDEEIAIIPKRAEKVYYNWMENIKDWCISRQLWWGHRIPVWYCADCGGLTVSEDEAEACCHCGSKNIRQDEDTLDTWFSSALWPFSTLGWPDDTPELEYFYPTDTLVTGYDILFFWVARMIFSGIEQTGEIPFKTVLFHGLIRDSQGRKMSKSLGNGIDPVDVIDKYGADALRFALITGNSPGNDMRYREDKVEGSRNFANKIWNAARFIHMNIDGRNIADTLPEKLEAEDKWILTRYQNVVKEMTENMDKFELGIAVSKLQDFIWDDFCDWYIELAKIRMTGDDEAAADSARMVLVWVMKNTLKLLHPFMPFISEEIWQSMPGSREALIITKWPEYDTALVFGDEEKSFTKVMNLITAVRTRRSEMTVPPSKKADLFIETNELGVFEESKEAIKRLASCKDVEIAEHFDIDDAVTVVTDAAKGYLPMNELVDREAEIARLTKELESAQKQLDTVNSKLQNETFMSKAPENIVQGVRQNGEKLQEKIRLIKESLGDC